MHEKYAVSRENTFCSIYIGFTVQFVGMQKRATQVYTLSSLNEYNSNIFKHLVSGVSLRSVYLLKAIKDQSKKLIAFAPFEQPTKVRLARIAYSDLP